MAQEKWLWIASKRLFSTSPTQTPILANGVILMRIRFLHIVASILGVVCFIRLADAAKASVKMSNDSTNFVGINKSQSYRLICSVSPMIFTFTKLGLRTPLYNNPKLISEGRMNSAVINLDLGMGYRRMNAIFRIGPFTNHTANTAQDQYDESDSLKLSDEYYVGHYSLELSYSCYYDKFFKIPLSLQIEPLLGYEWFLREYDGEVQDLKMKQKLATYYERVVSKGITWGGHITFAYPTGKQKQINADGKFIYETTQGPFIAFSYRNFSNIQYFSLETGLIYLSFLKKTIIERYVIFFRLEKFNSAIKGGAFRIGISSAPTFKTFFSE